MTFLLFSQFYDLTRLLQAFQKRNNHEIDFISPHNPFDSISCIISSYLHATFRHFHENLSLVYANKTFSWLEKESWSRPKRYLDKF